MAVVTQAGGVATLTVNHGCTDTHWIGCIYAKDQSGKVIHYEDKPRKAAPKPVVSSFKVPAGVTTITAYEWCNADGVYRSEAIKVE